MRLSLTNVSGSPINTCLGRIFAGATAIFSLSTAQYAGVSAILAGTGSITVQILEGATTASWADVPVLATASATTQTFTVAGVDTHSTVGVSFRGNLPAGCIASAQATAANTVKVTVINASGGNVDVVATTLDIVWTNPAAL